MGETFFRDDETQEVDSLANELDIGVLKKELSKFNKNVIFKEEIKKNAHLLEKFRHKHGLADNIIYIGTSLGIDVLQKIIYLSFNINHQVDISYD